MNVKETLEKVREAAHNEDIDALQVFEQDSRVTVQKAAQEAIDAIDQRDADIEEADAKENETVVKNAKEVIKVKEEKVKPEPNFDGWIDMTKEESREYGRKGILIGYHPGREKGLVKGDK